MDKTNFIDFIKESDDKEAEFHGWQLVAEQKSRGRLEDILMWH